LSLQLLYDDIAQQQVVKS